MSRAKKIKLSKLNFENLKKILPFLKINNHNHNNINELLNKIKLPIHLNKELIDLFLENTIQNNFKIPTMYT